MGETFEGSRAQGFTYKDFTNELFSYEVLVRRMLKDLGYEREHDSLTAFYRSVPRDTFDLVRTQVQKQHPLKTVEERIAAVPPLSVLGTKALESDYREKETQESQELKESLNTIVHTLNTAQDPDVIAQALDEGYALLKEPAANQASGAATYRIDRST